MEAIFSENSSVSPNSDAKAVKTAWLQAKPFSEMAMAFCVGAFMDI
jgi:hypothetical protein